VWHILARRFVFRIPAARNRRAFLRLGGISLGGLILWRIDRPIQAVLEWPGTARRFTGSYETGSFTGIFPQVSWLFDFPQPIDREGWRLAIEGAVAQPLTFTYAELASMATTSLEATLDCTGGWYTHQEWRGIPLAGLIDRAGLQPTARSVTVEAVSGYRRRVSLEEIHACLLATHVAGQPLNHGHGAPLRLVVPGQRGFAWVKWVTRIQVNETSAYWQSPLPLQ
jgi:DMSO/TMAO reductase YedYZ molybdopterin-dependent catalytic subunit